MSASSRNLSALLGSNPAIEEGENTIESLTEEYHRALVEGVSEAQSVFKINNTLAHVNKNPLHPMYQYRKKNLEVELSLYHNFLTDTLEKQDLLNKTLFMEKSNLQKLKESTGVDLFEIAITNINQTLQAEKAIQNKTSQRITFLENKCAFLASTLTQEESKWYRGIIISGICAAISLAAIAMLALYCRWKKRRSYSTERVGFVNLEEIDLANSFENPVYGQGNL